MIFDSQDISYTYDKLNNITEIYENDILSHAYEYDEYNQLIKEYDYKKIITTYYIHDNVGNILSKKEYDIDTNNLLNKDSYEYANADWKDQLTKFINTEIEYDEIGNPITTADSTLTWINDRELAPYIDSNQNITYKYKQRRN